MKKESEKIAAGTAGGDVIFEGMTSLRALLGAGENGAVPRIIKRVLYDSGKNNPRELKYIKRRGEELGFTVELAPPEKISELALGSSHGGVLAVCGPKELPVFPEPGYTGGAEDGRRFYVMLEGVEDPYNFGYALRSLYAAGVSAVILPPRNWMNAAGIVCRSSAGASELIPMFTAEPKDAAAVCKKAGMRIVCADIENSVSVWDAPLKLPLLLVIGGEKRGISRAVLDMADAVVRIDYGRNYAASLSAASAASILAFEVARKNRAGTR